MKVLTMNCGSSTLKFQLIETKGEAEIPHREQRLAKGAVEKIGDHGTIECSAYTGAHLQETTNVADHDEATRRVFDWLLSLDLITSGGLEAVGHRVVHGGERFLEPTLIDDEVIDAIEALTDMAPLHNKPALSAIRTSRTLLGSTVPMVAVFDTAFHRTLPERASQYPIPYALAAKHHIQRYGFHGLAHRYMTERYAALTTSPREEVRLITLQLGSGCSITAVANGRSVDTSMGFTPLEGLMMGTRSGDVDPSLLSFLARHEEVSNEEIEEWFNTRSGLVGVSGHSQDMRELLEAERQGDARAALAIEMFCYRIRKYIGAYLAVLGGADALVFGGGIGENAPPVRERICAGMSWCGLILNPNSNATVQGSEKRISADNSRVHVYVIPVDEAVIIARDTVRYLCQRT